MTPHTNVPPLVQITDSDFAAGYEEAQLPYYADNVQVSRQDAWIPLVRCQSCREAYTKCALGCQTGN
jgi:hypothetical protein